MKRTFGLSLILFTFFLTACGGPFTSTTSMLMVVKKGDSSDNGYWIEAYDPNNQKKGEAFKITVEEEMVWNLIEEDREYFSVYSKKKDLPWRLEQIEHSAAEGK